MVIAMLDNRHETFLALCKIRNYTKTAEYLNITQPAVSQHIRYLEHYYGGKLFVYQNRTLELTPLGAQLFRFASTMKSDSKHVLEVLKRDCRQSTQLRIGATLSIGEFVMPPILAQLLKTHPQLQIKVPVLNTEMLLEKLQDGEIDIALVEGYFNSSAYEVETLSTEPFVALCGAGHPLAASNPSYADLFKERLIIREKGSGTREVLEHILQELNLSLSSFSDVCEIGNLNAIKQLVENHCGITFMYRIAARQEIKEGRLKELPLTGTIFRHNFSFVYLKGSMHQKEYLFWLDQIKALCQHTCSAPL